MRKSCQGARRTTANAASEGQVVRKCFEEFAVYTGSAAPTSGLKKTELPRGFGMLIPPVSLTAIISREREKDKSHWVGLWKN